MGNNFFAGGINVIYLKSHVANSWTVNCKLRSWLKGIVAVNLDGRSIFAPTWQT